MAKFALFHAVPAKSPDARRAELVRFLSQIEAGEGGPSAGADPERMAAMLRWVIAGMDNDARDRAMASTQPPCDADPPDREAIRRRLEDQPASLSVRLWTGDLSRAERFYGPSAEELGLERLGAFGRKIVWGIACRFTFVLEGTPDGRPVDAGNGSMISFSATGPDHVDRVYAVAISLGATSVAAPYDAGSFYAASFRDPDGHRIEVVYGI